MTLNCRQVNSITTTRITTNYQINAPRWLNITECWYHQQQQQKQKKQFKKEPHHHGLDDDDDGDRNVHENFIKQNFIPEISPPSLYLFRSLLKVLYYHCHLFDDVQHNH